MNVKNIEKKEKNTAEITVEITAEEFDKAVNAAYLKNRTKINIPGFRKGKAPRKMIEKMYGESVFFEDALDALYPEAYTFAIVTEKIEAVSQPTLLDVNIGDDKTVTIKYSVALYPEVKIGEYKGIEAAKPAVRVLKSEVEEELERVRKRNARVQTADREAKMGDIVNIDFEGFKDGVPFEGGKDTAYDLTLGSGYFVPGFEEQLVGAKAGDEKEVNITFPENYTEELAGKDVVFKVKVNEVKESILPDLDDEFAKDVSEFDTLDEYKASLKTEISTRKKAAAENTFKENVMSKLIESMECDIPQGMIDERVDSTIENYNYRLQEQGMTFESYIQMLGMEIDAFREMAAKSATRELQEEIALDKIAELEAIEIPVNDIEAEYKKLAEQYNIDVDEVKKGINADTIIMVLRRDKAADILYSSAVVEKKKAKKEETASSDEEKAEE